MLKTIQKIPDKLKNIAKKLIAVLHEDAGVSLAQVSFSSLNKLDKLIDIDCPHFSTILPYRFYWEEKKLFVNEHSIGFGLELTVFSGADEKLINSISDLLRYRVSDDVDVQFILWGSNQVGEIIDDAYSSQLASNNIFSKLTREAIKYYKKAAVSGFKNKLNLPLGLREYRLFLFVSKNTPYSDEVIVKLENIRDDLTAELESIDLGFTDLTLPTFLSLLRSWINPNPQNIYQSNTNNEEHTLLSEQLVDKSFELVNDQDRLTVEIYPQEKETI